MSIFLRMRRLAEIVPSRIASNLRQGRRDESGQVLILTAVSMTVLLGIAALSIDASYMYDKRNRLHAAADAAAKSGAFEVQRNPGISNTALQAFANQQVTAVGFNPAGSTTVVVNHPPTSGAFNGNAGYVEAIVSEVTTTWFGRILGRNSMTPTARAVAGTGNPSNCLITTRGPGSSPYSLEFDNFNMALTGCGVGDSGDLHGGNPNSRITGDPPPPVGVVGSCSGTCGAMGSLTQGAPPPVDPLVGLAAPPQTGVNCPAGAPGTAATLSAGCYTSIASSVTTLNPGNYYITGKVDIGNLTGSHVLLYLTGAAFLAADNNKALHLTAQTSGTYNGIAIFQDPSDANNIDIKNQFTLDVSGVIYMPGTDVEFKNTLSITDSQCMLFIVKSLTMKSGNGIMSTNNCAATYGGAAFLSVSIAE